MGLGFRKRGFVATVTPATAGVSVAGAVAFLTGTVGVTTLTTPSNVQASRSGSTSITVSWGASVGGTGFIDYEVDRSDTAVGPWTNLTLTTIGTLAYTDSQLAFSTTYYYRVRSKDRFLVFSAYSSAVSATTSLASSVLQSDSGSFTVVAGQTGTITVSSLSFTPSVILFYTQGQFNYSAGLTYGSNPAFPLNGQTVNDIANGITFGAYDGTSQFSDGTGLRFADGRRDTGTFNTACVDQGSTLNPNVGCRLRGTAVSATGFTLVIDRSVIAGEGPMTVQWVAIGGCNAKIFFFDVPAGGYNDIGPQNISIVSGLAFTPQALLVAPWRQNFTPLPSFSAANGPAMGFASNTGSLRQAAIGSNCQYGGYNNTFSYPGFIAGSNRASEDWPGILGTLTGFTATGATGNIAYCDSSYPEYSVPGIALDCQAHAGFATMKATTGAVTISGAPFTPSVMLTVAAPFVTSDYALGTPNAPNNGYTPRFDYTQNGNVNVSFGFACQVGATLKQGGVSMFDKAAYSSSGAGHTPDIIVNGRETNNPDALHDGSSLIFTDAIAKGQTRITYRTFSTDSVLTHGGFTADGASLSQTTANGRAGKIAYLLLGGSVQPDLGLNPNFNGYKPFPTSEWYRDVSTAPVDSNNAALMATSGTTNIVLEGLGYVEGFAIFVVDNSQPLVPVVCERYGNESDIVYAPIPARDDIIAGYPGKPTWPSYPSGSDGQVIVFNRDSRLVYELYGSYRRPVSGDWFCANMAVWDADSGDIQRPYGYTGGDVAAMSLMMGTLRSPDIMNDTIVRATRYTLGGNQNSSKFLAPPAMHGQISTYPADGSAAKFGQRVRLKASKNIAGGTYTQRIVAAWKKYGLIYADTGTRFAPSGDSYHLPGNYPSPDVKNELLALLSTDFEYVTAGTQTVVDVNGPYPSGSPPVITGFTASATTVTSGQSVTLTPSYTGQRLAFLSPVGGVQRIPTAVSFNPTKTTWVTLHVQNEFAVRKQHKRIFVSDGPTRATTYDFYVSPTGSMSNSGTLASPFSLDLFNGNYGAWLAGMTIGFLDGTYDLSGLPVVDNTTPFYAIPGGVCGKPTILQAVNRRGAIISTGAKDAPAFGAVYDTHVGMAGHIQLNGLKFTTTGANFGVIFFGSQSTGNHLYDCEFSGQLTAGAYFGGGENGSYSSYEALIHACQGPAGKPLVRLRTATGTWLHANTAGVGGSIWEDYGGNAAPLVD